MNVELIYVLYASLFVFTFLIVEGLYYLVREARQGPWGTVNRRLRMIASERDQRMVLRKLRREQPGITSRIVARVFPYLDNLVDQAGLLVSTSRIAILMVAIATSVFIFMLVGTPNPLWLSLIIAVLLGVGGPIAWLVSIRNKRMDRFGAQLPDALDLMVRSMRAGHPLSVSMGLVASEMTDPAGTEFGIAVDEMTYGLTIEESMDNMAHRMPHRDLQFLIVAIQIQHRVGGNLAEILSNLSTVIRDRFQMAAKVRAVTSEARLSAIIIGALPFVVIGALTILNPGYYGEVLSDTLFLPLAALGLGLLTLGEISLWRLGKPKF